MQEQMPWEHSPKPACNGPQCKGQNRPTTPTPGVSVSVQDPMNAVAVEGLGENDFRLDCIESCLLISDPHIWRIDPPPKY